MKTLLSLVLGVGLVAALTACTSTDPGGGESGDVVVVEGYGAEYAQLFEEKIAKPFTEKTGIRVEYTPTGSASEHYAAIRAANGDPGFDVAVMSSLELYQGKQDQLLAAVSEKQVPNLVSVPRKLRDNAYGVGVIQDVQQTVLMYNKSVFPQPPDSWNVMWDPRYRSGALIYNPVNLIGVYAILIFAGLVGGGPNDVAPAFPKIAELAQYALATPQTSAEAVPFMEKGTASAFPYLDARAAIYAQTTDYDYTVPKEGTYASLGALGIPVGAKHKDSAYAFMDYWLSNEVQQRWAQAYNVGPAITGLQFAPEFADKHITTAEQLDQIKIVDAETISKNRTAWSQQWTEAIR